jgi:hypothetical protein
MLPDRIAVQQGGQASFSAIITPPEYDGVQMPFSFPSNWIFKPDSAPSFPVCPPVSLCVMSPATAGILSVAVLAQGDSILFKARVMINSCAPSGDPRVDDPEFRKQMFAELDTSRAALPWKERSGYLYQLAPELVHDNATLPGPSNTDCNAEIGSPQLPAHVGSIVGVWHTHPVGVGDYYVSCAKTAPLTAKTVEQPFWISGDVPYYNNVLLPAIPNAEMWILTPDVLYKLDPAHNTHQTALRWKHNKNDPNHCLTPIP